MAEKMWGYLLACRSGGTISVAGVYGGFIDKFPMGAIVNRALTIRSGQTHVHRYMRPLLECVAKRQINPSFVITHRMRLDDAPEAYDIFNDKEDECSKVGVEALTVPWVPVPVPGSRWAADSSTPSFLERCAKEFWRHHERGTGTGTLGTNWFRSFL